MRVARLIPILFLKNFLGRGSDLHDSSKSRGCLPIFEEVNLMWAARHAADPWFLLAQASFTACTHVGVLPNDPSRSPRSVITGRFDHVYYIILIKGIDNSFRLLLTLQNLHQT